MSWLYITYIDVLSCKDTLPKSYLYCCSLIVIYNILVCLLDEGEVSQQVLHENYCEMFPQQAFDYTS